MKQYGSDNAQWVSKVDIYLTVNKNNVPGQFERILIAGTEYICISAEIDAPAPSENVVELFPKTGVLCRLVGNNNSLYPQPKRTA